MSPILLVRKTSPREVKSFAELPGKASLELQHDPSDTNASLPVAITNHLGYSLFLSDCSQPSHKWKLSLVTGIPAVGPNYRGLTTISKDQGLM